MPIQIIGAQSGTVADVDTDRNQFVTRRTPGANYGAYSIAVSTGAITATLASGANLFDAWWAPSATKIALIESLEVSAYVVSTITAAVPWELQLIYVRGTPIGTSGGTALASSASAATATGLANQTRRTGMAPSAFLEMRVATTSALGAIGNVGRDAQEIGRASGNSGTVVGTQFFAPIQQFLWRSKLSKGAYPLVMEMYDTIFLRSLGAGPASGTFSVVVRMNWSEVPASAF